MLVESHLNVVDLPGQRFVQIRADPARSGSGSSATHEASQGLGFTRAMSYDAPTHASRLLHPCPHIMFLIT